LPFIPHPLFVASSAELSNDDAAERRQGLLTLLVRQPTPKLLEHQRDRRARGGIMVIAAADMGLLLESRIGEFASTATTRVSRKGRLWALSPHSVQAEQWGLSSPCFYLPGRRSSAWRKIKPSQVIPCVIIGYTADRDGIERLLLAAVRDGALRYVGHVTRGLRASQAADLARRLRRRAQPVVPCRHHACWVEPEVYCRVQCQGWTCHGHLRHAVFRGLLETPS
jgi:ATP dependent DNA ligase C terminal region